MTDVKPKISVIVVTYNQEATIGRTLDSILSQKTDFPIEIIVGDDCSTDRTAEICRRYASRYPSIIRFFENEYNKGLVDNYYDCLLECRGEYMADCAGDDWWIDPDKLSKQAAVLDADAEISLVHTAWNRYDELSGTVVPAPNNDSIYHRTLMAGKDLMLPVLRRDDSPLVHLCTALYRRDMALEAYRSDTFLFRSKEFTCEDLQMTISLCNAGKIAYIPDITLNYSVGKSTVSSDEDHENTVRFYVGTLKLTRYLQLKYSIPDSELEKYYRTDLHFTLSHAFKTMSPSTVEVVIRLIDDIGVDMPMKSKLIISLSRFRPAWRLSCLLMRTLDSVAELKIR